MDFFPYHEDSFRIIFVFLLMFMFNLKNSKKKKCLCECLSLCMCTMCAWYIQRPEEGVGSSGIGLIDDCELLCGSWSSDQIL